MAKKQARRRGLVLGYLELISSAIFDRYRKEITELVGGKHGIYALYRNKRLYYVGLATDLKNRVNQHLRDRHAGRWNYFSLYLVRSQKFLRDLESLAVGVAFPRGNRVGSTFGGAPDLKKHLKRKMSEKAMAEIRELMGRTRKEDKAREAARKAAATRKARQAETKGRARKAPLKGLLKQKSLRGTYKGRTYYAWVYSSGRIKLKHTGKLYDSPSGAAAAVIGRAVDGWHWWRFKDKNAEWVKLDQLRRGGS